MEDIVEEGELSFASVIVVTNLPAGVAPEKQPKLHSFLSKVISSDPSTDILDIHMPLNPANSGTLGIAIVTLADEAKVPAVIERVDGFEVSKGQALAAFPFDVAESILEDAAASQAQAPTDELVAILNRETFRDWMLEEPRMEQLLTRFEDETEIFWIDPLDPVPRLYYGGEREKTAGRKWCDLNVEWSPSGTYLATFHSPGLVVWGGRKFSAPKTRFEHTHVAGALWSPNEEFLLTFRHPISPNDKEVVKVWRVLTGELLRSFGNTANTLRTDWNESGFLWSPSSKFLSRIVNGSILVYDSSSMKLVSDPRTNQPAPLRYTNVKVMSWAPRDEDWLAVWSPEGSNEPASLVIVALPSREEITAKKLFSTGDSPAEIWWHPLGDFVALKASRLLTRSKKTGRNVLEIIRLREKGCPSEPIEGFGTSIVSAAWEPVNNGRLALVVGDEKKVAPSATNPTGISTEYKLKIYSVQAGKPVEEPTKENVVALLNASFNSVVWSPNGQHFVHFQGPVPVKIGGEISAYAPDRRTGTTGNPNGELLFYSSTAAGLELLRKEEHMNMNRAIWDPSGRFLVTAVELSVHEKNAPSYKMEQYAGYCLWTFQGRSLKKVEGVRLWNVEWRPHVGELLSGKEKKTLLKSLRDQSVVFDEEDRAVKNAKKSSFMSGFKAKQDTFQSELAAIEQHFQERLAENTRWTPLYSVQAA